MNIVDMSVFDGLRDLLDDEEVLRANFIAFKQQLNNERKQICADIEVHNWNHLAQLIRRVKVEAHQFGAIPLAEKCREIEAALHGGGQGFSDGTSHRAEEVLSLMKSVENFIDGKFAS